MTIVPSESPEPAELNCTFSGAMPELGVATATATGGVFGAPVGDDIADLYRLVAARPSRLLRDGSGQRALGVEGERLDAFLARALPAAQAA